MRRQPQNQENLRPKAEAPVVFDSFLDTVSSWLEVGKLHLPELTIVRLGDVWNPQRWSSSLKN